MSARETRHHRAGIQQHRALAEHAPQLFDCFAIPSFITQSCCLCQRSVMGYRPGATLRWGSLAEQTNSKRAGMRHALCPLGPDEQRPLCCLDIAKFSTLFTRKAAFSVPVDPQPNPHHHLSQDIRIRGLPSLDKENRGSGRCGKWPNATPPRTSY